MTFCSSSNANSVASTSSAPTSSSSSRQPPPSSRSSSKMSPNTSSNPDVVIRCGFVIPQIRLTPPDQRPGKAPKVPEQDLGANSLYVPLRTEEVGWEEGGLIWAPKRFCYPTINLYGGADDRVIGTYRGGPEGYRFINITDPAFSLADESTEASSSPSTKTRGGKSKMPKGPAKVTATPSAPVSTPSPMAESPRCLSEDGDTEMDFSSSNYASSSASSSRQSSFSSNDDDHSSGADTGMTTPARDDDEAQTKANDGSTLTTQLDAALTDLLAEGNSDGSVPSTGTRKLASRAGARTIPCETVDAARLGGPLKQQLLKSNTLGHDRSLTLAEQVPTQNFAAVRGRATAKLSVLDSYVSPDDRACEFAGGWVYEQNMQTQHRFEDADVEAATTA